MNRAPHRRFLGWRMLVIAIAAGSLTGPGQTIGVSVFINSFIDDLELSRDQVSLAYLFGTLTGSLAMPTVGRLLDRHGVRRSQLVITALFGLALLNMSAVTNWWWLAAGFVLIRMLGQGSLSMASTVTVALWFERLRGRAMGMLGIGVSAGIALAPILLNASIDRFGWRGAWISAAVAVTLVLVPLTWFGLVDRPDLVGQRPDGGFVDGGAIDDRPARWGFTRKEAVTHPALWVLVLMSGLTAMLITGLNFHQIDLLVQAGLTADEAAQMFLPQIAGSTIAGFIAGWLLDRTSGRLLPAVVMMMLGGCHLLATGLGSTAMVILYALALGLTAGTARVVGATLLPKWFGTRHIGALQGVLLFTGVGASALGPFVLSVTRGWLDGYGPAALVLGVLPAAAAVVAMTIGPPANRPVAAEQAPVS